jgi:hypothetical protein
VPIGAAGVSQVTAAPCHPAAGGRAAAAAHRQRPGARLLQSALHALTAGTTHATPPHARNTVMAGILVLPAFALRLDASVKRLERRLPKRQPWAGTTEKA